jgi:hypothetical protein
MHVADILDPFGLCDIIGVAEAFNILGSFVLKRIWKAWQLVSK